MSSVAWLCYIHLYHTLVFDIVVYQKAQSNWYLSLIKLVFKIVISCQNYIL